MSVKEKSKRFLIIGIIGCLLREMDKAGELKNAEALA